MVKEREKGTCKLISGHVKAKDGDYEQLAELILGKSKSGSKSKQPVVRKKVEEPELVDYVTVKNLEKMLDELGVSHRVNATTVDGYWKLKELVVELNGKKSKVRVSDARYFDGGHLA